MNASINQSINHNQPYLVHCTEGARPDDASTPQLGFLHQSQLGQVWLGISRSQGLQ